MGSISAPWVESTRKLRPLTEWFSIEGGQNTFLNCTFAFTSEEHHVYTGQAPIRKFNLTPKIINDTLKYVPDEEIYPVAPAHITITSSKEEKGVFVKGPALSLYNSFTSTDILLKLLL